jgi:hypothetical protein
MSVTSPKEMETLLQQWKSTFTKISDEELQRVQVDGERAMELSLHLLKNFDSITGELDKQLSPALSKQTRQMLKEFESVTKAFYAAEILRDQKLTSVEATQLAELREKVRVHDDELFSWAWVLFRHKEGIRDLLTEIRAGRGFRDDAEDVLRLVKLYREQWSTIKAKSPYSEKELTTAAEEATQLLTLWQKTQGSKPESHKLFRQGFVVWSRMYDELKAVGRFVARSNENIEERFPKISRPRSRKTNRPTVEPAPVSPEQS